uniref:SH2 domain containing 3Cb n=1 Tax=Cynoglossus semilaevis TaxID=244447 RepID=A0A3P8VP55_CYNSE
MSLQVSETLVLSQGDFLVRQSQSSPGDFVLTCRWDQRSLHFLIRKTAIQAGETYTQVQSPEESTPCSPNGTPNSESRSTQTATRAPSPPSPTPSVNSRSRPLVDQDPPTLDADRGCYTELYLEPQSYTERLKSEDGLTGTDQRRREEDTNVYVSPVMEMTSFNPTMYQSKLMPERNKPLEASILRRVKELLSEIDPKVAAQHITKADCKVARILDVSPEVEQMMGVSSGMELLTLPHGQQLRRDLLERFHTMATMLAVDLLGCTGTNEERACLFHKMILIAAELKSNMGNMFGFAAVMRALELPQVSRLEQTWVALRQRHTESAILYEKTLRPFMKRLDNGRESCPLTGVTFPHVLPLLFLMEKKVAMGEGADLWEVMEVNVDVVMFHLGAARTIAQLGGIYQSNAETKLQDFQEQPETMELFLTDFQLRLLWGSRGATENQALRYAKFDQVLTALSNKLEPPVKHTDP